MCCFSRERILSHLLSKETALQLTETLQAQKANGRRHEHCTVAKRTTTNTYYSTAPRRVLHNRPQSIDKAPDADYSKAPHPKEVESDLVTANSCLGTQTQAAKWRRAGALLQKARRRKGSP